MAQVTVTLKRGKHQTQPWTFTIDKPGPASKETKRTRYASKYTAKRGAIRQLGAWRHTVAQTGETWWECLDRSKKLSVLKIKFIG